MLNRFTGYKRLVALSALSGGAAPVERTATGNPVTFLTDLSKPLKSLVANFLPIQSGTGDPSPTNIRPITGWTGLDVWHGGKNLLGVELEQGTIIGNTGQESGNSARVRTKDYIFVKAGTYTTSAVGVGQVMYYLYKTDGTYDRAVGWKTSLPSTVTFDNDYLLRLAFKVSANDEPVTPSDVSNVQLEIGSSATSYEAPNITKYPVTWSTHGTIYGGYVDMVTGELWATYAQDIDDGSVSDNWSGTASGTTLFRWVKNKGKFTYPPKDGSTSNLKVNYMGSNSSPTRWYAYIGSTGNFLCYTPVDTLGTKDDWLAYLAEHPLQIVYELSEPVLITTLTPQQIRSLIGTNTIWSDANDDIEVTYYKKES